MLRSAGVSEVLKFHGAALLNLSLDEDSIKYSALQIPPISTVSSVSERRK